MRENILTGKWPPGKRLVQEQIAEELGVSRTPIRHGLQELSRDGLVEFDNGNRAIVRGLTREEISDVYQTHALLAGRVASQAVARIEEGDILEMRKLHTQMLTAYKREDFHLMEPLNWDFHRTLYRAGATRPIRATIQVLVRNIPRSFFQVIPEWHKTSIEDHGDILDAVASRNAYMAQSLSESHVLRGGALLLEHLEDISFFASSDSGS